METLKDKLQNIVGELHDKYENNQFIFNKFVSCIEQLPELLDNTNTRIIEKEKEKTNCKMTPNHLFQNSYTIINSTIILPLSYFLNIKTISSH